MKPDTDPLFNNKFGQLSDAFFTRLSPTGFVNPFLVSSNPDAMLLIGFEDVDIDYFSGNKLIPGGNYLASVYSGHQFGHYVPQLGDGRAIMIGEAGGYEIQLKGCGKTPYSRFGDGRAVLRSCIREYLCSEAMHNLGIPTTRALCIIGSDEDVQREQVEKAAMLTRLSPSHIRFGHFEYFYYTGQHNELRELADFTIKNYYPGANYDEFFEQVVLRTAALIARWQAVGFAHGVMNTDNMSILGLTIDYGPFGFMEEYNPAYICNHSDHSGRYAFDQQPYIGLWNLHALGMSLSPLISNEKAGEILQKYQPQFAEKYIHLMWNKLGFETPQNPELLGQLLDLLEKNKIDYTNFFRKFSDGVDMRDEFLDREGFNDWHKKFSQNQPNRELMRQSNPKYILRNYLAENAIKTAQKGAYNEVGKLLELLRKPYDEQPKNQIYAANSPDWARNLEVSCSS